MKTKSRLLQPLSMIGIVVVMAFGAAGCSGAEPVAGTANTLTTAPAAPTSTTGVDAANCDFEVGPAVVRGAVSQTSGGIGGWIWHSVQPLGCPQWFPVVNLSSDEVAVNYEQCFEDCVADGISTSIDTFEMELRGRFVLRSDLETENVIDSVEGLVFVADGMAHMPDANRSMVSDIVDTRWIFTTQITRTTDGFVAGNAATGLNLELTAEQATDFVELAEGESSETLRVYGITNGKGSIAVESIEFF